MSTTTPSSSSPTGPAHAAGHPDSLRLEVTVPARLAKRGAAAAAESAEGEDGETLVLELQRDESLFGPGYRVDIAQGGHFGGFGQRGKSVFGGCGAVSHRLDQRVPGVTCRALTQPLGAGATTFGADVYGFIFSHGADGTV